MSIFCLGRIVLLAVCAAAVMTSGVYWITGYGVKHLKD